jgi:hypothetical protein
MFSPLQPGSGVSYRRRVLLAAVERPCALEAGPGGHAPGTDFSVRAASGWVVGDDVARPVRGEDFRGEVKLCGSALILRLMSFRLVSHADSPVADRL